MTRKRVGVVIFEGVEVLDFCGPYEVFSVVRLDEDKRRQEPSPFEVWLVAENSGPVSSYAGMRVLPDHTFETCPDLDILVVPGGMGSRREMNNPTMLTWVRARAGQAETLTSVCTGALILGAAGLLDGRRATTHWRSLDMMRQAFPQAQVVPDQRVVEDGQVITSAGIAAGLDMALTVVARYHGPDIARATARHMEYRYP